MELKIYKSYDDKNQNEPVFDTSDVFSLVDNDEVINNLIDTFKNGTSTFFLNEHRYEAKDLSFSQVNIKGVCRLCFVFVGNNDKDKIIAAISSLKEMPVETDEDKENKVKAVFENIKPFNPIFSICDTYFSFINGDLLGEEIPVLSRSNFTEVIEEAPVPVVEAPVMDTPVVENKQEEATEKAPKEKKHLVKNFLAKFKKKEESKPKVQAVEKTEPKTQPVQEVKPEEKKPEKHHKLSNEKKNLLIDIFYVISMPALMLIFLFIAIDFFSKDKAGLGAFIVVVLVIETGIFGYGLYLINCEEQNHHFFNKSKLLLYGINLAGLIIGFLFALLIGALVLKIEDNSKMFSIAFICLESAFIMSIVLHIVTLVVSQYMERRKERKRRGKKK